MKFDIYFFDLDDTLLDFQKSQIISFEKTFLDYGIENSLEVFFDRYRALSNNLWSQFEKNEIKKETLRVRRFELLFEEFKIDIDPYKFSDGYLKHLAENNFEILNARRVLDQLKSAGKELSIITNGIRSVQHERLHKSGLISYFTNIVVSEDAGVAKPHPQIFEHALNISNLKTNNAIIIGDKIEADVLGGLNAGIHTCWYNPSGRLNKTDIQPHYEIACLKDVLSLE